MMVLNEELVLADAEGAQHASEVIRPYLDLFGKLSILGSVQRQLGASRSLHIQLVSLRS